MRLDEQALDEYTDRFTREAFRYETLTRYEVDCDSADYARWLAGETSPDRAEDRPWSRWVRAQLARQAAIRRVRVVYAHPLSEHLRFELGYQYNANAAAGEEIRILDLTAQARPEHFVDDEFWLLDGDRAAVMIYGPDGAFLHAEAVEGGAAQRYRRARDAAWATAEPFEQWWACHPEYHRARA